MMSERQLSILVPIGCIINELSHTLCMMKGPRITFRNRSFDVAMQGLRSFDLTSDNHGVINHGVNNLTSTGRNIGQTEIKREDGRQARGDRSQTTGEG